MISEKFEILVGQFDSYCICSKGRGSAEPTQTILFYRQWRPMNSGLPMALIIIEYYRNYYG